MKNEFDVVIVGGGVTGTAIAYELARYTNIEKIALIEKYGELGSLNSSAIGNSQTNHVGDIETNYSLDKAIATKQTAGMMEKYCKKHNYVNKIIFSHQKMALGVGEKEVDFIQNRYDTFAPHFSALELWDKSKIKEFEPMVVQSLDGNDRKEPILAIGALNQLTTVDYGKLTKSFFENAQKENGKTVELFLNSRVTSITESSDGVFTVIANGQTICAKYVVVNAGAHSLHFAHQMGYGLHFGCLPMAGSFYMSKQKILNGKVYMVQNDRLPFAALHGDPDLTAGELTRFGPTAVVLPKLERYKPGTQWEFWKSLNLDMSIVKIFIDLLKEKDIRDFIYTNFIYELPLLGKREFIKNARKIVPSLRESDIEYAKGFGGIRPQALDKKTKKMIMGEATIETDRGIVFNMTPSPGATSCMGSALKTVRKIAEFLNKDLHEELIQEELISQ